MYEVFFFLVMYHHHHHLLIIVFIYIFSNLNLIIDLYGWTGIERQKKYFFMDFFFFVCEQKYYFFYCLNNYFCECLKKNYIVFFCNTSNQLIITHN
jgi:hypothetical protein